MGAGVCLRIDAMSSSGARVARECMRMCPAVHGGSAVAAGWEDLAACEDRVFRTANERCDTVLAPVLSQPPFAPRTWPATHLPRARRGSAAALAASRLRARGRPGAGG
ncbi:Flagellar motor rotation protein MotB [Actinacidiphila cocklensis]|uniref:Flagellar motor rotation protein MotB n=1 Tax=Actinacidiphila cocklensis TaxID=887465 RepID=A0A9W4EAE4_9ACTN|nr:Flagellar motor rotation protein MotB [Actinacidiphila cocklensis]